jgi:hypothetical protein
MRMQRIAGFLLLTIVSVGGITDSAAQATRTLRADLALIVQCNERPTAEVEDKIERFLTSEGFKELNVGRLQREKGVAIYDLHVFGLEGNERILDFLALPRSSGRYAVTFYMRPPTVRAWELERKIATFITERMGCRVDQTTRGENGPEAADMFYDQISRREGWFKQAEALKPK